MFYKCQITDVYFDYKKNKIICVKTRLYKKLTGHVHLYYIFKTTLCKHLRMLLLNQYISVQIFTNC